MFRTSSAPPTAESAARRGDAEAQIPLLVDLDLDDGTSQSLVLTRERAHAPITAPYSPPPDYSPHPSTPMVGAGARTPSQQPRRPRRQQRPTPLLAVDPPMHFLSHHHQHIATHPSHLSLPSDSPLALSPHRPTTAARRLALLLRFALELVFLLIAATAALASSGLLAWGAFECARVLASAGLPALVQLWADAWQAGRFVSRGSALAVAAAVLFAVACAFASAFAVAAVLAVLGAFKFAVVGAPHVVQARWRQMRSGE